MQTLGGRAQNREYSIIIREMPCHDWNHNNLGHIYRPNGAECCPAMVEEGRSYSQANILSVG